MIDPQLNELVAKVQNRYSLVSVLSKRARQIVEKSVLEGEPLEDKAVSLAVDDLMLNRIEITYPNVK